jgi:hypothetical protein
MSQAYSSPPPYAYGNPVVYPNQQSVPTNPPPYSPQAVFYVQQPTATYPPQNVAYAPPHNAPTQVLQYPPTYVAPPVVYTNPHPTQVFQTVRN